MILDTIDWDNAWEKDRTGSFLKNSEDGEEERWDRMALLFRNWMNDDDYPSKLSEKIKINTDWSVLDIGCGTGSVAIEAATKAGHVTALDISGNMLEILKNDAEKRGINNITCVHSSWQTIRPGIDIQSHDVVIASRSIARAGILSESLKKIDKLTKRYAYVTAWGGNERGLNRGLMKVLGYEYTDLADYVYVFNILHRLGIRPNVEQIECKSLIRYPSLEDAVEQYTSLFHLSLEQISLARAYLLQHLIKLPDGTYQVPDNKPVWSLIWWKKE